MKAIKYKCQSRERGKAGKSSMQAQQAGITDRKGIGGFRGKNNICYRQPG